MSETATELDQAVLINKLRDEVSSLKLSLRERDKKVFRLETERDTYGDIVEKMIEALKS